MTDTTENTWLDDPPESTVRIESVSKIRGESKRGTSMVKRPGKKAKAWDCDGQYVFFRRRLANPATLQRLMTQVAKGELKHITTSDDVEMYEVQDSSPFKRKEQSNLGALDLQSLVRSIVVSACKRKWIEHLDGLEELAYRFKNMRFSDNKPAEAPFAKMLYEEKIEHIFNMILQRGGPSAQEMGREIGAIRQKRGDHRSRTSILLPG